ncbi:MAG: hypothetical protein V4450_01215 [Bacteroidota bacterium]
MAHLFNRNALELILHELVDANVATVHGAKYTALQSIKEQLNNTGAMQLNYTFGNSNIIPVLEDRLVGLMNQEGESRINAQLHAPTEPVTIYGDPFFLDAFLASLFSILIREEEQGMINVHVTEGDEKCIIEIERSGTSFRGNEDRFTDYLGTVFPVWQKIIEDNGGELKHLLRRQNEQYIRIKLTLA